MRTYEYPNFVDKEKIDMDDGEIEGTNFRWRSILIIPFKGAKKKQKKVITFLMKNPSITNKNWTDKTIYKVRGKRNPRVLVDDPYEVLLCVVWVLIMLEQILPLLLLASVISLLLDLLLFLLLLPDSQHL